jgi:hypothetical protein
VVRRTGRRGYQLDYTPAYGGRKYTALKRPIEARPIEIVMRSTAAANASRLHPLTTRYVLDGATFDDAGDELARAASNLALAGSATGRRCLQGAIADCRIVLGERSELTFLARFYEPGDWPALVRRVRSKPEDAPANWSAERTRCLEEGTADICGPLMPFVPVRYPFGAAVRATFFSEAVLAGGEQGLQRLVAARGAYADDPLGLLAHVAKLPEDSLIARWRTNVAEQGRLASRDPIAPVLLTSLAWSGLLLFGASLRRPR